MSYTVAFIDKTVLTDRTDLGTNYSETNVRNAILDAQRFDLYDIMGKKLYERFDSDIQNDTYGTAAYQTSHPDYYELMEDYIVPYLTWASYSRLLETIYITPRNNGLVQRGGDGTSPVGAALYNLKKTQVLEKMNALERKLVEKLIKDRGDFDELSESTNLFSDRAQLEVQNSRTAYFGNAGKGRYRGYNI